MEERNRRVQDLEKEIQRLETEDLILTATDQALLTISTKLLGQSIDTIDKLVTAGLKAVFEDQRLDFKARVERYRGKTSVKFELDHEGVKAPIRESYGGGVQVLAGVLLRIATILALGLRKILILDESLSHVSPQYVPQVSKLLRKLAQELDFTIVMISHDDSFAAEADVHYQAVQSSGEGTTFRRLHPTT